MKKNYKQAIEKYEQACNGLAYIFCMRHGFDCNDFDWVGGDIGGVLEINDYYVGIDTIKTDIEKSPKSEEFFAWYDYSVRAGMLDIKAPNFDNWLMKCPIKTEKEILELEALRNRIEELKDELKEKCCDKQEF